MPTNPPTTTSTNMNTQASTTYAQMAKTKISPITEIQHPTEEQGMVFNCINEYKIRDYLVALTKTTTIKDPKFIIAASKVSKNRIIIHLKSKELVEKFFENHTGFEIDSNFIKCRRLSNPMKKIILSHVNPSIPNNILEDYVKNEMKLEITAPLSYLRLNPHDLQFGHIISWRRQFYTSTEIDKDKITGSFLIPFNGQNHRIFVTCDEFSCFKCHSRGHQAENCTADEALPHFSEYFNTFPDTDRPTDELINTHIDISNFQPNTGNLDSDVHTSSFPPLPTEKNQTTSFSDIYVFINAK